MYGTYKSISYFGALQYFIDLFGTFVVDQDEAVGDVRIDWIDILIVNRDFGARMCHIQSTRLAFSTIRLRVHFSRAFALSPLL